MSLPIKNAVVSQNELKQTVARFVQEFKKEDPAYMVVTFTRQLPSQQHEVISMGVTESMPAEIVEKINQRVEALMKEGFLMSQNYSDVKINNSFKGANFDPTSGGIKFGS